MSNYEFTRAEQAAIEAAAHEQLGTVMADRDAEDAAYGIAQAIRGELAAAALHAIADQIAQEIPTLDPEVVGLIIRCAAAARRQD